MPDFGEYIEESIKLFRESETPLVVRDISLDVTDIAHRNGHDVPVPDTPEDEAFLAQIDAQVRYMLHPGEEVTT